MYGFSFLDKGWKTAIVLIYQGSILRLKWFQMQQIIKIDDNKIKLPLAAYGKLCASIYVVFAVILSVSHMQKWATWVVISDSWTNCSYELVKKIHITSLWVSGLNQTHSVNREWVMQQQTGRVVMSDSRINDSYELVLFIESVKKIHKASLWVSGLNPT